MFIKLNKKQKQFLFDNFYVDSKALDAAADYKGWQNYFIDDFEWHLDLNKTWARMNNLKLINEEGDITYDFDLNFQKNDLNDLLNLR